MAAEIGKRKGPLKCANGLLRKEIASVLHIADASSLSTTVNLFDVGMDSLTATEVVMRLDSNTGLRCRDFLIGQPTIESICQQILGKLCEQTAVTASKEIPSKASSPWWQLQAAGTLEDKRNLLEGLLKDELQKSVPAARCKEISTTGQIADSGLDSLAMVELACRLKSKLGLPLSPNFFRASNDR